MVEETTLCIFFLTGYSPNSLFLANLSITKEAIITLKSLYSEYENNITFSLFLISHQAPESSIPRHNESRYIDQTRPEYPSSQNRPSDPYQYIDVILNTERKFINMKYLDA